MRIQPKLQDLLLGSTVGLTTPCLRAFAAPPTLQDPAPTAAPASKAAAFLKDAPGASAGSPPCRGEAFFHWAC